MDYLVDGRLHFPHGTHCDDHGVLEVIEGYETYNIFRAQQDTSLQY